MSKKITHEQARESVEMVDGSFFPTEKEALLTYIKQQEKQEKLLELYKEFFDKLNIQLRNTYDIDYIYPHEFIIGYDIKSENKELVKLFKQIKEIENEGGNDHE